MKSDIHGFSKLHRNEKIKIIKAFAKLEKKDVKTLKKESALEFKTAEKMIENVVSSYQFPYGIATNFRINRKDYLIPMVLEEPSVVAAASHAAKLCRPGGFTASSDEPIMIGQIQLTEMKNISAAKRAVLRNKAEIKKMANNRDSVLCKLGGGIKDVEAREIDTKKGKMLIVHIIVDVRDAMGANCINTMSEAITPFLEEKTGGKAVLRIISNLADRRLARASCTWKKSILGDDVIDGIISAYEFAKNDVYRCATNNKGIMNGIDAVAIATGNDFRALEAGAHAYAAKSGKYQPLARYEKNKNGDLTGSIELPIAVGLVGGATRTHPLAQISLKILGVKTAQELAQIMACVGLANNFAALRAMVKEGIQKGHMKLHAKNIAIIAGADKNYIDKVEERMVKDGNVSVGNAVKILKELKWIERKKKIKRFEKRFKRKVKRKKK